MLRYLITYCLLISFHYSQGQIGNQNEGRLFTGSNFDFIHGNNRTDNILRLGNNTINYKDISGTPYIDNSQKLLNNTPLGKLYTSKHDLIGTFYIRYNAFTDNMELSKIDDGIDYYLLKKEPNAWYIVLGKNKYRAYNYRLKGQDTIGFFVLLSESDTDAYTLLKKERVEFKDEVNQRNSFVNDSPAQFVKFKDNYYLKVEEILTEIPKKEIDFYQLFHSKQHLLKEYIKINKYKVTKEEDLLEIVSYYNSLIK